MTWRPGGPGRLRRDLGTLEAYAALVGVLIGAGIFRVTGEVGPLTGPSVVLAYLVLAPAVLATSVAYAVYLSTPLGAEPGGEYLHISRTFGGLRLAFVGAWLKIVSYLGALAYLANAMADYVIEIGEGRLGPSLRLPLALGGLIFFYAVHLAGVRWFGRIQIAMLAILALSLVVLVVPGLPAIRASNLRPFFTQGAWGFASALPPLFFAYAGFESLAQAAGEVRDGTRRLPAVFLRGVGATSAVFFLIALVTVGVLPMPRLAASAAPMAEAASVYLPYGAAAFVNLGAIMAITTSLNATMLVPSRLAMVLAQDGLAPGWLASIHPRTGTPAIGLTLTLVAALSLLASGQLSLALNIAVLALVVLYFLHSLALLLLPRRNPGLHRQARTSLAPSVQRWAAIGSMAAMGALIVVQVAKDVQTLSRTSLIERLRQQSLTSVELTLAWGALGAVIYVAGRRGGRRVASGGAEDADTRRGQPPGRAS